MKVAIILAGAVAKGAFEAGALEVITQVEGLEIERVVGASSGSLNGAVLASGVHQGDAAGAAKRLGKLWEDVATLGNVFHPNLRDVVGGQGFSDQSKLIDLLSEHVPPHGAVGPRRQGLLYVAVGALNGVDGHIRDPDGPSDATTYEAVKSFDGGDFETKAGLKRVFETVVASCSIPGVFAPSEISGIGPCVDGGTVNNSPIKYAVSAPGIDAIVVISPTVAKLKGSLGVLRGADLLGHCVDMLINERLYRDLREAEEVNRVLERFAQLPAEVRQPALKALGWESRRPIHIIDVRPEEPLAGNAFSAFLHKKERKLALDAGRKAALAKFPESRITGSLE